MSKKILVILIILITLVGCSEKKEEEIVFVTADQPIEVEYGEDVDVLSNKIILETNGEIIAKNTLNTELPGIQIIEYTLTLGEQNEVKTIEFLIKDPEEDSVLSSYGEYKCVGDEKYYFKTSKIAFIFNPDGNQNISLVIVDGSNYYYGAFEKVSASVYSFKINDYNGEYEKEYEFYRNLENTPKFPEGVDGYFKIEDKKLYFITEELTVEEMEKYQSEVYCELSK